MGNKWLVVVTFPYDPDSWYWFITGGEAEAEANELRAKWQGTPDVNVYIFEVADAYEVVGKNQYDVVEAFDALKKED